jgi:hypothetical protein
VDSKEIFEKTLEGVLADTNSIVGKYREALHAKMKDKETLENKASDETIKKLATMDSYVEGLTAKLAELTKSMDILKGEMENIEKKAKTPTHSKKGGGQNLFDNREG